MNNKITGILDQFAMAATLGSGVMGSIPAKKPPTSGRRRGEVLREFSVDEDGDVDEDESRAVMNIPRRRIAPLMVAGLALSVVGGVTQMASADMKNNNAHQALKDASAITALEAEIA